MATLRLSRWTVETGTLHRVLASGGDVVFSDPAGQAHTLYFGAMHSHTRVSLQTLRLPAVKLPAHEPQRAERASLPDPLVKKVDAASTDKLGELVDPAHQAMNADTEASDKAQAKAGTDASSKARAQASTFVRAITEAATQALAAHSAPSTSPLYMTGAFARAELTQTDLRGAAVLVDARSGLIAGLDQSVVFLGIHATELEQGLSSSAMRWLAQRVIAQAPALMFVEGAFPAAPDASGIRIGYLN